MISPGFSRWRKFAGHSGYDRSLNVIASEANQSILSQRGKMDCFALLALTLTGPRRVSKGALFRAVPAILAMQIEWMVARRECAFAAHCEIFVCIFVRMELCR